jgi:hypothetical protein
MAKMAVAWLLEKDWKRWRELDDQAGAHLNSSLLYLRAAHVRLRMTSGSARNRTEITDHGKPTMGCTGQPLG